MPKPPKRMTAKRLRKRPTEKGLDARSPWCWARLASGDLILGTFPQGDTYLEIEKDAP